MTCSQFLYCITSKQKQQRLVIFDFLGLLLRILVICVDAISGFSSSTSCHAQTQGQGCVGISNIVTIQHRNPSLMYTVVINGCSSALLVLVLKYLALN